MTATPDKARAILAAAGAKDIRVEQRSFGWLVACDFGAGCTDAKDNSFDTPEEVAAHLVTQRNPQEPPHAELLPPATDATSAPPEPSPEADAEPDVPDAASAGDMGADDDGLEDEAIDAAYGVDSPGIMVSRDQRKSDLAVTIAAMARERMDAASDVVRNTDIQTIRHKLLMGLAEDADRVNEAAYNRAVSLIDRITRFADDTQRSVRDMDDEKLAVFDPADLDWPQ